MALQLIRVVWVLGGVDDVFNADRRDYHFGAQLRFSDQDIKSILPFTPSQ